MTEGTMGLACDSEGYDIRMTPCPKCGSRGCPQIHRFNGKCPADKPDSQQHISHVRTPE